MVVYLCTSVSMMTLNNEDSYDQNTVIASDQGMLIVYGMLCCGLRKGYLNDSLILNEPLARCSIPSNARHTSS